MSCAPTAPPPASLGAVVKNSAEIGRPIRGDDYGKLEG